MRSACVFLFALLSVVAPSWPQSFDDRLQEGYASLKGGDIDGALTRFRDLETDDPDNDLVHYSLATARYQRAMKDIEGEAAEDATASLTEARAGFEALLASPDPFVRQNAGFNAANCSALLAKQAVAAGNHEETVKAFEESVRAYEEVLRVQPGHEGARKNLDHMRYLLKKMLQNPPPPQDQQQSSDGEQEKDKQGKDNENQQQEGEQNQNEEQEPSDQNSESENPPDGGQPQSSEKEAPEEPQDLNRQNIEAILQSLDDQDRQEQERLRRSKVPPRVRGGKWW